METHPTSVNMSTDYFTITVNVTSLEKSLIVCIEPESPVSMTLYLGFEYQPNHTFFHLNMTLPKAQVEQKGKTPLRCRQLTTALCNACFSFLFKLTSFLDNCIFTCNCKK